VTGFELSEAAALVGRPVRQIRSEVERVAADTTRSTGVIVWAGTKRRHYRVTPRGLVYLQFVHELNAQGISLRPKARQDILTMIEKSGRRTRSITGVRSERYRVTLEGAIPTHFDLSGIYDEVSTLVRRYRRGRDSVERRADIMGGEAIFRGTRIPVQHIVDLIHRGVSVEELREDYPALSEDALEYARVRAAAGRRPGRPRRRLGFKQVAA